MKKLFIALVITSLIFTIGTFSGIQSSVFAGKDKKSTGINTLNEMFRVKVSMGEKTLETLDSQYVEKIMEVVRKNIVSGKEIIIKPRHLFSTPTLQLLVPPDKIVVYAYGAKHVFTPKHNLFKQILFLFNTELQKPGFELTYHNSNKVVTNSKQNQQAVEFQYKQVTTNMFPAYDVKNDNKKVIQAKSLFFVLTGENKNYLFYSKDKKDFSTSALEIWDLEKLLKSALPK